MTAGTEQLLLRSAGLETEPEVLRRLGMIAAILWIVAPAGLIPAMVRIEPAPPESLYLLAIVSVLIGAALLRVPWDRLGWPALHVTTVAAVLAITTAYVLSDQTFAAFFFMPATFAAYAFRRRAVVAGYLALIGIAIVAGLLVPGSDPSRDDVTIAIAGFPILVVVACAVAYQRERLDASRRAYRRLALEAVRLSMRIGDRALAGRSDDADTALGRLKAVEAALALEDASGSVPGGTPPPDPETA